MRKELREFIIEENKYYALLENNKQYRLQGSQGGKVIVGIIKGDRIEYKQTDHLIFKCFDTWKEAYLQLS